MSIKQLKAIFVILFALTGSSFISLGTNWMVGVGVFFCLWALAGMLEGDQ
jgi:hypothetical protein